MTSNKKVEQQSLEALLDESKQYRDSELQRDTLNNLLRMNELKKQELLQNTEIKPEIRAIELHYLEHLHDYWLAQRDGTH